MGGDFSEKGPASSTLPERVWHKARRCTRRKSTAALSAAVDTTTCNGAHTTFRRNQVSGNRPCRMPAALREGARGRRFSQKNGYLPQRPPGKGLAQSSALYPQEVHGGFVSRRGHNHLQRSAHNFQAEPSQRKPSPPNASRSSGGSAREALLSEKRLPPPAPFRKRFGTRLGDVPAGSPRRLCQPPWT